MSSLKVFPAIGVARVGNSDQFFIGPEQPGVPANWDPVAARFRAFKDADHADHKVLRQAARFRVFEVDEGGNPIRELTLAEGVEIEWHIHVANRKASFFTFNGQSGAESTPPYTARASRSGDSIEKEGRGRGQPERKNLRNAHVGNRRGLEIDPGERTIASPGSIRLEDNQTDAPIHFLGEAKMDGDGRLLFLPGFGVAQSNAATPSPIDEYANNDSWFDDICDGSIHAVVKFADGRTETAESAWVIVGPPDFAPGIGHVVTLYDTLWDLAVRLRLPCAPGSDAELQELARQQQAWREATSDFTADYEPSFTQHIYPVLSRALAARDVHQQAGHQDYHGTLPDWPRLSQRNQEQVRREVFEWIRDPNASELDRKGMPRGLGDDYTTLDDSESGSAVPPSPRAFLSLPRVQYALLKAWAEGRFREDWTFGDVKYAPIPAPGAITPHGLTRAALENCVGGPFYPGIEVSWLIRQPELYSAAFRLKPPGLALGPLTFEAGFFSQQMALPWHADFYDCHKEEHTPADADQPLIYMWWTAQRPDDIRPTADSSFRRWVEPFDPAREPNTEPDDLENLARFEQMRTRWFELSFVVLEGEEHVEQR